MATCQVPEAYLTKLRERYRKARKKDRGKILDELVATTGYHRKHAIALLRGKRRHRNPQVPIHRLRRRLYLAEDKRAVLWLAELFDQISSKRLRVERRILAIAQQDPTEFGLDYGTWSLARLQWFVTKKRKLVKRISREHLRRILKKGAPSPTYQTQGLHGRSTPSSHFSPYYLCDSALTARQCRPVLG